MARILLAEDDTALRLNVAEILEDGGHQVVAPDADGLAAALEQGEFDLVVTDLNMPRLNGWDVADLVRRRRPGTPVIAISGFSSYLPPEQLSAFASILPKPVRDHRLLAAVRDTLRPR